ncbi:MULTISPECIES: hypothetical protein [Burkholderia]|uniref:hypothetical protein n=1 Tax=Burkholderia TaxID=32008 RepID=UPI0012E3619F|nr:MULTISPECIES: hypothetical protein [Burkholderia]QHP91586.1 hypothetical protein EXE55_11970 [Burkholderia glumae]
MRRAWTCFLDADIFPRGGVAIVIRFDSTILYCKNWKSWSSAASAALGFTIDARWLCVMDLGTVVASSIRLMLGATFEELEVGDLLRTHRALLLIIDVASRSAPRSKISDINSL